jgi:hypothetical protein
MANLPESTVYQAGIYQWEVTDPATGGATGIATLPLRQLADRTNWLKSKVDAGGFGGSSPQYNGNMDTLQTPGTFHILSGATQKPSSGEFLAYIASYTGGGGPKYTQLLISLTDGQVYSRQINVDVIGLWQRLVRSSEITGITKTTGLVTTFSGNWQNVTGFGATAHKQLNRVWLSGRVEEGDTNNQVFTIPSGFRPVREFRASFFNRDLLENETVVIRTNGNFEIYSETNSNTYNGALYFPLDWISYEV